MIDLIFKSSGFDATDPRDKLFALMGLATEAASMSKCLPELRPDYSKTAVRTFADFSSGFIRQTRSVGILSTASRYSTSGRRQYLQECPSWAPEFDKASECVCLLACFYEEWRASQDSRAMPEDSDVWDSLLHGFLIDKVRFRSSDDQGARGMIVLQGARSMMASYRFLNL